MQWRPNIKLRVASFGCFPRPRHIESVHLYKQAAVRTLLRKKTLDQHAGPIEAPAVSEARHCRIRFGKGRRPDSHPTCRVAESQPTLRYHTYISWLSGLLPSSNRILQYAVFLDFVVVVETVNLYFQLWSKNYYSGYIKIEIIQVCQKAWQYSKPDRGLPSPHWFFAQFDPNSSHSAVNRWQQSHKERVA